MENLKNLREENKNKALIISATGTGKTYLSAFDAKVFNPKKLLFVVHRLTIAKDSLKTFQKVFGNNKTMGLYSGEKRALNCDFVFSTIQTISKSSQTALMPLFRIQKFDFFRETSFNQSMFSFVLGFYFLRLETSVTRSGDFLDFGQVFKVFGNN